jgi:hypothetical protein
MTATAVLRHDQFGRRKVGRRHRTAGSLHRVVRCSRGFRIGNLIANAPFLHLVAVDVHSPIR